MTGRVVVLLALSAAGVLAQMTPYRSQSLVAGYGLVNWNQSAGLALTASGMQAGTIVSSEAVPTPNEYEVRTRYRLTESGGSYSPATARLVAVAVAGDGDALRAGAGRGADQRGNVHGEPGAVEIGERFVERAGDEGHRVQGWDGVARDHALELDLCVAG